MSRIEPSPSTEPKFTGLIVGGVAAVGVEIFALNTQSDWIFDNHNADIASDKVSALNDDIQAAEVAKPQFDQADSQLSVEANQYLDGVIADKKEQVQAIREHAPQYGTLQKFERNGMVFGETFSAWLLVGIGVYKARKAMASHKAIKQAANETSVTEEVVA